MEASTSNPERERGSAKITERQGGASSGVQSLLAVSPQDLVLALPLVCCETQGELLPSLVLIPHLKIKKAKTKDKCDRIPPS